MFRLYDASSGLAAPVRPARPGELRIWVAGDLRACLVGDLVGRVAEGHHLRVSAYAGQALRAAWAELNIHPAELAAAPPDPLDVAVAAAGQPGGSPAHRMQPGAVRPAAPDTGGLHPLALRLALLERHYREPVHLSREALAAGDRDLRHWRELVAGWADSPSKPMCAQYTGDILGAFDDDLDTPAAVRSLEALAADPELPAGSKFESFAYYDQLFGLDLARDVGR